ILYLARRIRSARILIVLMDTHQRAGNRQEFRAEILRLSHSKHIRICQVGVDDLRAVLQREVGRSIPPDVVSSWHFVGGASPVFLRALLDDWHRRFATAEAKPIHLVVGDKYKQAVQDYLYRCAPTTRQVAGALAILDGAASPALVAQLVNLDIETVDLAVQDLGEAGLTSGYQFRHPATRTVALDCVAADDRSTMRHGAAQLLHEDGATP